MSAPEIQQGWVVCEGVLLSCFVDSGLTGHTALCGRRPGVDHKGHMIGGFGTTAIGVFSFHALACSGRLSPCEVAPSQNFIVLQALVSCPKSSFHTVLHFIWVWKDVDVGTAEYAVRSDHV
jgi:hypothetical protein